MHIDVYGLRHRPLPKWAKSLFLEKIGRCLCVYEPDEQFKEYNKVSLVIRSITRQNSCRKPLHFYHLLHSSASCRHMNIYVMCQQANIVAHKVSKKLSEQLKVLFCFDFN